MQSAAWVELVGDIIIARIRGIPTEALVRDCQQRVVSLLQDTEYRKILYDALELEAPSVDVTLVQQNLSEDLHERDSKIALVVPNTRIAYLSRLAFGSGNHRVFYNDMSAALRWLDHK